MEYHRFSTDTKSVLPILVSLHYHLRVVVVCKGLSGVKSVDFLHIILGEFKIKNVYILLHPFNVG